MFHHQVNHPQYRVAPRSCSRIPLKGAGTNGATDPQGRQYAGFSRSSGRLYVFALVQPREDVLRPVRYQQAHAREDWRSESDEKHREVRKTA
eukprot:2284375-Rhodomonas_salina.1